MLVMIYWLGAMVCFFYLLFEGENDGSEWIMSFCVASIAMWFWPVVFAFWLWAKLSKS
jgi:hypothetical protein